MTVFSQPWPTSVTPPVTLSCASISKMPPARTTVPWVGAAASIASWIVHRVAAGSPSTGETTPGTTGFSYVYVAVATALGPRSAA